MYKYYIFNKPYNVLSQFSKIGDKKTLSDFLKIEKDCYPVGRLDYDSEGLIILTNDKSLNYKIAHPNSKVSKTYLVQVEGEIKENDIKFLLDGVEIKTKKGLYFVKAKSIRILNNIQLPERNPPIRFRKNIPTSIIEITLTEGKNRQIRKMTSKIGFPTLRIIRIKIGDLILGNLKDGEFKELSKNTIFEKLNLAI